MDKFTINGSITIHASVSEIWNVLTNPDKIMLYLGSQTTTDWKVGSLITWEGEMHGTKFQNKGKVLENVNNKQLRFTYWSGMGGDKDLPENYSEITYVLKQLNDQSVELTYTRINIPTEMEKQIFEQYLPSMLEAIKKLSEEK